MAARWSTRTTRSSINSPETVEALKYAKALYETFIPGTLSWLDTINNKAFLAGEIGLTQNGISVYYAAKNSDDPAIKAMAEDIYHARMPIGPVGNPTERALVRQPDGLRLHQYPNAAKEYLRFMMEKEQYDPYLKACIGYWNHPLQAYEQAAGVDARIRSTSRSRACSRTRCGTATRAASARPPRPCWLEFVLVQMVASVVRRPGDARGGGGGSGAARRALLQGLSDRAGRPPAEGARGVLR